MHYNTINPASEVNKFYKIHKQVPKFLKHIPLEVVEFEIIPCHLGIESGPNRQVNNICRNIAQRRSSRTFALENASCGSANFASRMH